MSDEVRETQAGGNRESGESRSKAQSSSNC